MNTGCNLLRMQVLGTLRCRALAEHTWRVQTLDKPTQNTWKLLNTGCKLLHMPVCVTLRFRVLAVHTCRVQTLVL